MGVLYVTQLLRNPQIEETTHRNNCNTLSKGASTGKPSIDFPDNNSFAEHYAEKN